jgi:flagellar basal-body rod modification protein FlgD
MTIAATTAPTPTASNSFSIQDFLKILTTQLQYQDPLKPMDNQQFMAQLAQFTTLEQTQQLNAKIDQLISTQSSLQSVGLIGRTVDITTSTGPVTGTVSSLSLTGTSPSLTIAVAGGASLTGVSLSQISAVH